MRPMSIIGQPFEAGVGELALYEQPERVQDLQSGRHHRRTGDNDDLPKLYATAAEHLNLAPSQHTEVVFKSILGNCQSVVGNLAGLRNKLGDAHGQGR
jgi:hypothetical protein